MRRLAILFWFIGVSAIPAQAGIADKNKELTKIQAEINTVSGNIARIEKEQSALLAQLADIECIA